SAAHAQRTDRTPWSVALTPTPTGGRATCSSNSSTRRCVCVCVCVTSSLCSSGLGTLLTHSCSRIPVQGVRVCVCVCVCVCVSVSEREREEQLLIPEYLPCSMTHTLGTISART